MLSLQINNGLKAAPAGHSRNAILEIKHPRTFWQGMLIKPISMRLPSQCPSGVSRGRIFT
jgi:hypothetical protein